jgi:hypothetical protein
LALVAAGDSIARLLPLATGSSSSIAVALFTDAPLPTLPSSLEAYPLGDLPESIGWADFLAIDMSLHDLPDLPARMGIFHGGVPPCPGQALVQAPMPCAGLGDCGVCALETRHTRRAGRSWKLACKDGPVFDLTELIV